MAGVLDGMTERWCKIGGIAASEPVSVSVLISWHGQLPYHNEPQQK